MNGVKWSVVVGMLLVVFGCASEGQNMQGATDEVRKEISRDFDEVDFSY